MLKWLLNPWRFKNALIRRINASNDRITQLEFERLDLHVRLKELTNRLDSYNLHVKCRLCGVMLDDNEYTQCVILCNECQSITAPLELTKHKKDKYDLPHGTSNW